MVASALFEELQRCWGYYRDGLIGDLSRSLPSAHARYHDEVRALSTLDASNATVELAMLDVVAGMVTAQNVDEVASVADDLAEMVYDESARCDDLHKLAALSCSVHAAMRLGRLPLAQGRFRATLKRAKELAAEGGGGVGMAEMGVIVGCAGLHLAQAAATAYEEEMTTQLLDQSDQAAAELALEAEILGQYFGPDHVRATRCICLARLEKTQEALDAGRAVNVDHLIPLMGGTVLRVMADMADNLGESAEAGAYRARADALVPPLERQFR